MKMAVKISVFIFLLFKFSITYAELEKSAYEIYTLSNLMTHKSIVSVVPTKYEINAVCAAESKKRDLKPLSYRVNACTFWDQLPLNQVEGKRAGEHLALVHVCTIVIPEKTSNNILGHEIRHCFQGHFHPAIQ